MCYVERFTHKIYIQCGITCYRRWTWTYLYFFFYLSHRVSRHASNFDQNTSSVRLTTNKVSLVFLKSFYSFFMIFFWFIEKLIFVFVVVAVIVRIEKMKTECSRFSSVYNHLCIYYSIVWSISQPKIIKTE